LIIVKTKIFKRKEEKYNARMFLKKFVINTRFIGKMLRMKRKIERNRALKVENK
jgi:hypothetical protein